MISDDEVFAQLPPSLRALIEPARILVDDDEMAGLSPEVRASIEQARMRIVDDDEIAAEIAALDRKMNKPPGPVLQDDVELPTPAPDENGAMPREVLRAYRRLKDAGRLDLADKYMSRYHAAEQACDELAEMRFKKKMAELRGRAR